MKILVTGGTGGVGRPTVQWLLDRGHEVRVLDLRIADPLPGAEYRKGDITDPDGAAMFGRSNFWTSLDVRDAAQAAEKALLADYEGSHPVHVTDARNFVGFPSEELARVFFPEVTMRKKLLVGEETLVSIEKVRALIGFEPQYPFEDSDS